ncbi:Hypothetical predicted protein [Olea europaea subsp. europaea]|uniref:Uncharacterized protein n=1 Tax=Olea europaea subsp. europaea TaxID=158383 RepID=A0A8S0PI68_OLEEU|nr:Hypothetical predicted protein [Olea europaea subsp. europaea]
MKLRKKSPLELSSKKLKVVSSSSIRRTPQPRKNNVVQTPQQAKYSIPTPFSFSQFTLLAGSNSIAPSSANVVFHYPVGTTILFQLLMPPSQSAVVDWMYNATQSSVGPLFTPTSEHEDQGHL